MDALRARLDRKIREAGRRSKAIYAAVWVRHFERRKTGRCKDEWAPHVHIVLWPNLPGTGLQGYTVEWHQEFSTWIQQAWYEIVDSDDENHLKNGVRRSSS